MDRGRQVNRSVPSTHLAGLWWCRTVCIRWAQRWPPRTTSTGPCRRRWRSPRSLAGPGCSSYSCPWRRWPHLRRWCWGRTQQTAAWWLPSWLNLLMGGGGLLFFCSTAARTQTRSYKAAVELRLSWADDLGSPGLCDSEGDRPVTWELTPAFHKRATLCRDGTTWYLSGCGQPTTKDVWANKSKVRQWIHPLQPEVSCKRCWRE